jgi:hypothetical protein
VLVEALLAIAWAAAGYAVWRAYAGERFGRALPLAAAAVCALIAGAGLALRHRVPPPASAAGASAVAPPSAVDCARLGAAGRPAVGALDRVESDALGAGELPDGAHVGAGARITLSGWATALGGASARGACAVVDGRPVRQTARYGARRDDVAAALDQPRARDSGYAVSFSAGALGAGPHLIRIAVLEGGGRYALLPLLRRLVVDP